MTQNTEEQRHPGDQPVMRFAVLERQVPSVVTLGLLTLCKSEAGVFSLELKTQTEEAFNRLSPILQAFRFRKAPDTTSGGSPKGQELVDVLAAHNLVAEEIPLNDAEVQIQFDLRSGLVVGTHKATHAFADPNVEIGQRVFEALAISFENACDDLADQITAALNRNDFEAASRALEAGMPAITLAGTPRLLAALVRMDAQTLKGDDRKRLLDCRLTLSQRFRRYDIGAKDAEWLLREEGASLPDEDKSILNMAIALGSLQRGNRETGIAQLRRILADPSNLSAEQRGWAWRNLSIALEPSSSEAMKAARLSSDAFLEAGLKSEAGRSTKCFVNALMHEKPEDAIASLTKSIELLDKDGLPNRAVYASALHERAKLLLTLERFSEAYEDSKAAVEVLRGIMGVEEQFVSSLHAAALAAHRARKDDEANAFEVEASALTEKHELGYFQLAERLSELVEFDESKAKALIEDAKAAGNVDIVAATNAIRANNAPGLEPHERIAQLEDALREFRVKARPEIVNMIKASIGTQLRTMQVFDRAATWFQDVANAEPLNAAIRDNLIDCLWKSEQWSRAAAVLRKALDLRGEFPGLLFAYAKSLLESGNIDDALTAAHRSIKLTTEAQADLRQAATDLRDTAIEMGGKFERPMPKAQTAEVMREELERALEEFSRFIAGRKRMTFWKKGEWTPSPEGHAQNLLHTYLEAKFGDRVDIFEELDTGAGRLDLYVKLKGGLAVVLELKMCGGRYSSDYAASGETQIEHYMDNRETHIGYLVIFDARVTMHAKPLLSPAPRHTIIEVFVDVRRKIQ